MMRHFNMVLFLICSIQTYSQFDYHSSKSNIEGWLTIIEPDKKVEYLNQLKKGREDNCAFTFYNVDEFYIIDFDNDGLNDILYSGSCGIDGSSTQLYRFNGDNFDSVLSVIGILYGVPENQCNIPFSILINNYACCGGFTNVFEQYAMTLSDNKIKFSVQSRVDYVSELELPEKYFDKPFAFRTIQGEYKLRFAPMIDDTTEIARPYDAFGNTIHIYSKNSIGYAIAMKTDISGRIWWFVKMDNNSDPKMNYSKSFGDNNEQITYSLGWLSSRFLEVFK